MKKTIVAFGDSNTHGYCSQTGGRFSEEERWTCLLEQYLGNEYRVMEEGLSGRTTVFDDPLFEGLNGLSAITQCLLTHEPVDLLIIMLGTNDTKARFCCNAENIAKGLERLAGKAMSTTAPSGAAPGCCLSPPPRLRRATHQPPPPMKWDRAVWRNQGSWPSGTKTWQNGLAAASWTPAPLTGYGCIPMIICIWIKKAMSFWRVRWLS